jgi:hypothetical protein
VYSQFNPPPQQIVIDTNQLNRRRVVRMIPIEFLDGYIEIKQQRTLAIESSQRVRLRMTVVAPNPIWMVV